MSIRIGIFDFFAYTIPGGLLVLLLAGWYYTLYAIPFDFTVFNPSFGQLFSYIVISYLAGLAFDPVFSRWGKLFGHRDMPKNAWERIVKRHPNLDSNINYINWPIWLASIRRENLELSFEIDRHMAMSKMVRGVGFFLAALFLSLLTAVLFRKITPLFLFPAALLAGLSLLSMLQSVKFNRWYFSTIFETILSRHQPFDNAEARQGKKP